MKLFKNYALTNVAINVVTAWQQNDNKVSGKYVGYIEYVRKWTAFNVNINGVHSETNIYGRVRVTIAIPVSPVNIGLAGIFLLAVGTILG